MEENFRYRDHTMAPFIFIGVFIISMVISAAFLDLGGISLWISVSISLIIVIIYSGYNVLYGRCYADEDIVMIHHVLSTVTIKIDDIRKVSTSINTGAKARGWCSECVLEIRTDNNKNYFFREYLDSSTPIPFDALENETYYITFNKLKSYIEKIQMQKYYHSHKD